MLNRASCGASASLCPIPESDISPHVMRVSPARSPSPCGHCARRDFLLALVSECHRLSCRLSPGPLSSPGEAAAPPTAQGRANEDSAQGLPGQGVLAPCSQPPWDPQGVPETQSGLWAREGRAHWTPSHCMSSCPFSISDPFIFNLCSKDRSSDHYSCRRHSYGDLRELRQARFLLQVHRKGKGRGRPRCHGCPLNGRDTPPGPPGVFRNTRQAALLPQGRADAGAERQSALFGPPGPLSCLPSSPPLPTLAKRLVIPWAEWFRDLLIVPQPGSREGSPRH